MMRDPSWRWRAVALYFSVSVRQWLALEERATENGCDSRDRLDLVLSLPLVESEDSSNDRQQQFVDALVLQHVLWHVSLCEWRALMRDVFESELATVPVLHREDLVTAPPTVVLALRHDKFPEQVQRERWEPHLQALRHCSLSSSASSVISLLCPTRVELSAMELVLSVAGLGVGHLLAESYLSRVLEFVTSCRDIVSQGGTQEPNEVLLSLPLSLQAMDVELTPSAPTTAMLRQILQLQATGVPFRRLQLRLNHALQRGTIGRGEWERFFSQLLHSHRDRGDVAVLSVIGGDTDAFEALCGALSQDTTSVSALHLSSFLENDSNEQREHKWNSLVSKLWGRRSTRRGVRHLRVFDLDIRRHDAQAIAAAVRRLHASDSKAENGILLESLVLSWGVIFDKDVVIITDIVKAIGSQVQALSISFWGILDSTAFSQILTTCNQLTRLEISNVRLTSLDALSQALEQGECPRLEALSFQTVNIPNESLVSFCELLGRRTCVLAQRLRQFHLDGVGLDAEMHPLCLDALLNTLSSNDTLEYLCLTLPPAIAEDYRRAFLAHGERFLGLSAARRLPTRSSLAFLSVISQLYKGIDDDAASLILNFASTPTKRWIVLE
ncbi:hypothetical protein PINS_up018347 [Pythium insidiosum]|nr:hypothetical protein PINS_up018347 [Pythium insidiosum]